MAFNWLGKVTSFLSGSNNVGIDISDSSLEFLALSSGRKVIAYGREILPDGIVVDGEIKNPGQLAEVIKRVISKSKVLHTKNLSACFVFPKIKTFISNFEYDNASFSAAELSEMVRMEVSKSFKDSLDDIVWDFAPLGVKDKSISKRKMLYAVAGKTVVWGYTETAKLSGFKNFSIEIEPVLLRRALMPQFPKDLSPLIVDIGANSTSLYIFTPEGDIEYSSNIKIGGNKLTSAISEKNGISIEAAEKLKIDMGLKDLNINPLILKTIAPIKDEIPLFIQRHEQITGKKLSRIILAGGGSLVPWLDLYFKSLFSVEVVVGNPLLGLKGKSEFFDERVHPVLFANVIGAGLKNKGSAAKKINFVPAEQKQQKEGGKSKSLLIFLILLVIALAVAAMLFFTGFFAGEEAVAPPTAPPENLPEPITAP